MAEYAIAGAGTSKTTDRLVRLFVAHFDADSFRYAPANAQYDEPPKEAPGQLGALAAGARATLVIEAYVLWVYRAYHVESQSFRWVTQQLRTDKNGVLHFAKSFDDPVPEVGKQAPPLLWNERDGYLFWTYTRSLADRVLGEVAPKEGSPPSPAMLTRNGFVPLGCAKYSSLASGSSIGGDSGAPMLFDLLATQVPGLPYLDGYDLFDGATLAAAYEGCPCNKLVFEPNGTYLMAKRPQIASVHLLEAMAYEMRRILGNAAWFLGALGEYSEVVLATVDGKPIPTMQDRLFSACKGFKSSQEDVATALRQFAQQCAENVFQLAKKQARKAQKAAVAEARKRGEEVLAETVEDIKLAARKAVLDEWRKHIKDALGPEMLIAMVRLRKHGIAFQNVLVEILHAANPIVDPVSILANIREIMESTMAYFDAYMLGMELRECFAGARELGVPEWFSAFAQQKALVESQADRVRAGVRSIFDRAKTSKVDHVVDVALHCDSKNDPKEAFGLVGRFDVATAEWGIDWWNGAIVSLHGLVDERVKEAVATVDNLAKEIEEGLTHVFSEFAHEFLGTKAGTFTSSVDCNTWIEGVAKNLSAFGLVVGTAGKETITLDATGELRLAPTGFVFVVSCEGKKAEFPIRIAALDRIDDAVAALLGGLGERAPWARSLITKKAEKNLYAAIEKALAEKTLASASATITLEVPTFAAGFTKTAGVVAAIQRGLESLTAALNSVEEFAEKDLLPWIRVSEKAALALENAASIVSFVMMGKNELGLKVKTSAEKIVAAAEDAQVLLGDLEKGVTVAIGSAHELETMFEQANETVGSLERVRGAMVLGTSGSASASLSLNLAGVSPAFVPAGVSLRGLDTQVRLIGDTLDFSKDLERLTASIRKEIGLVGAVASTLGAVASPAGESTVSEMGALSAGVAQLASRHWLEQRA